MTKLTCTHHLILLPIKDNDAIYYYIDKNVKEVINDNIIGILICKKETNL